MDKQTPRSGEWLRSELLRLGARDHEIAALTMVPSRGESALRYALQRNVEHPVAYAIKLFDSPDWHPSGEKPSRRVNVHVGEPSPLPLPAVEENLVEARRLMETLWPAN